MQEFCKDCKKECEYVEVKKFVDYYNETYKTNYTLQKCPDAEHEYYTCDLVYGDENDELYIEVKRAEYGFGEVKRSNLLLAGINGQMNCQQLIHYVIMSLDDSDKIEELDDFMINIPVVQLSKGEFQDFCVQLREFLVNQEIDDECEEFCFLYKKSRKEISIIFRRKNDDERSMNDAYTLYEFETEKENTLGHIFEKLTDISRLKILIEDNFRGTSEKKYPKEAKRKILLNVLKLPTGYKLFFDLQLNHVISEINKLDFEKVQTSANEGYLLYFDEDFKYINETQDGVTSYSNALVIIPLLGEGKKQSTIYYEDN